MSNMEEQEEQESASATPAPQPAPDASSLAEKVPATAAHKPEQASSIPNPLSKDEIPEADAIVLAISRRQTRRSFLGATVAVAGGYGLYRYISSAPTDDMQPVPLQRAYAFSAFVSRTLFPAQPLAPTYPLRRAEDLRINGI